MADLMRVDQLVATIVAFEYSLQLSHLGAHVHVSTKSRSGSLARYRAST